MDKTHRVMDQSSAAARVSFGEGQGDLQMVQVSTRWSTAEIYLHGAHVTQFQKREEPPLLFLSQCSRFEKNQPIRGGIPIILPWFGRREGMGQHGFARNKEWQLKEVITPADGTVTVRLRLPDSPEAGTFPSFRADYAVTVNETLTAELMVVNTSNEPLSFENCLHTYFAVADATSISIHGLKGATYLDQVENFAKKIDNQEAIRISSEVDRIYLNTTSPVEIADPRLGRRIRVEKHGSASTVVWNPWIAKAQQMPDFGNDEYENMICVESGNVGPNRLTLRPGESSSLEVKLGSEMMK
jgi:glucose-6-phosphate 1-epimerase